MKTLRRRRIAKQYGITYKRITSKRSYDRNFFRTKDRACCFTKRSDAQFIVIVKNPLRWAEINFMR